MLGYLIHLLITSKRVLISPLYHAYTLLYAAHLTDTYPALHVPPAQNMNTKTAVLLPV